MYLPNLSTGLIYFILNALLSYAKKDTELYCAVCRALVDEVNYSISQVDPKQKVQVGSFRVDSRGNQKTYEVPLGRSEVHLTEVFENICDRFKSYGLTKNEAGKKSIVRMTSRNNQPLVLKDVQITAEGMKSITFICESIVDDHDDNMITLFRKNVDDIDKQICVESTELCTEEDISVPMPEPGPVKEDPAPEEQNDSSADAEVEEEKKEEKEEEKKTDEKDDNVDGQNEEYDEDDFVDLPPIEDFTTDIEKDEL